MTVPEMETYRPTWLFLLGISLMESLTGSDGVGSLTYNMFDKGSMQLRINITIGNIGNGPWE